MEARDADGVFYPFTERAAKWTTYEPGEVLRHLRDDRPWRTWCRGSLGPLESWRRACRPAPVPLLRPVSPTCPSWWPSNECRHQASW
ncbi:hypothetical protein [Streptomyces chartreusis]|uniref:hypothetical protein n=1 Tax=Streptomyces chartreusis TaxID=1969 RepID=UPI00341A7593